MMGEANCNYSHNCKNIYKYANHIGIFYKKYYFAEKNCI